jgi:hypothetical protein
MSDSGGIVDWLLSTQGRIARIVVGSLLIIVGLGVIGGIFGVVLLILGAVPIASAAYGTFLLAPFFGRDIHGSREGGAPTDEEPEPEEEDDDAEAREDESGQEQGGSRRGEESSEEPQEQLEKDAPGDTTATRDQDAGDGRRDRTSSGGGEDGGEDAEDRPAPSRGADTRPMRAERPPDQGPRTKDLRADDPGSSGSSA